jgi:hypothetical protein
MLWWCAQSPKPIRYVSRGVPEKGLVVNLVISLNGFVAKPSPCNRWPSFGCSVFPNNWFSPYCLAQVHPHSITVQACSAVFKGSPTVSGVCPGAILTLIHNIHIDGHLVVAQVHLEPLNAGQSRYNNWVDPWLIPHHAGTQSIAYYTVYMPCRVNRPLDRYLNRIYASECKHY